MSQVDENVEALLCKGWIFYAFSQHISTVQCNVQVLVAVARVNKSSLQRYSVQTLHQVRLIKNYVTKDLNHGLQGAKVQDSLATRY
jgi:hypothetical protein